MNEGVWLVNSQSLIEEKGFVCDGDISLAKAFLKLVRFQQFCLPPIDWSFIYRRRPSKFEKKGRKFV